MFTEKRNAEAARVIDGTPVFLFERLRGFHGDTRGSMAILMAFFAILLMGVGVLAVDVGRMMVLRSQMQNAADAAAKAAALQLNAKSDAFNRGNDAAAIAVQSTNFSGGGGVTLSINTVTYYTEDGWATGTSTAVDYENATIASVTLNAENINLLLRPVLEVLNKSGSANFVTLNASATARLANYICNRAPLFACNPFEGDPTQDFYDIDRHTGKQYTAKGGGGGSIAPGNFGLLDPDTGSGAQAAGNAIATGQPNACGGMDVSVDTGNKAGAIRSGVNTRFDIQGSPAANYPPYGPPNVMEYPDDSAMIDAFFGNSNWDPAAYWAANHASPYPVADLPIGTTGTDNVTYPTRLQMYLYELGVTFAINKNKTLYPYSSLEAEEKTEAVGLGYTEINPPGYSTAMPSKATADASNPTIGYNNVKGANIPATSQATNGEWLQADEETTVKRRLMKMAVVNCTSEGVSGNGAYDATGTWIYFFITKQAGYLGGDAAIYAEYAGTLGAGGSGEVDFSSDFHPNVELIQ